ncbi:MAG: MaoC family dehydratase N-terminal domain-containing protein [Burkholderiales bacterium]|nr:MaoC family dehydratase N-terminal domain-containing protein [Burkholderiales bacterium]
MAVDYASYQRLLQYKIPEIEHKLSVRDTMLYALGLGLGADPMDQRQLRFVYEKNLLALPTMAVVLAAPHAWVKKTGTGFGDKTVHGEQTLAIHKPLPVEGELVGVPRLASVVDKGPERGALIVTERKVYDKKTGDLVCTLESTSFCRGDGGFGGPSGPVRTPHPIPEQPAQLVCDLPILPHAALIYRLSGDYNPLHADPEHARRVGFPRPILHGLCSLGMAGHALLRTCCDYDPARIKAMEVRFSAPVYPGETLRTEIWREGNVVSFRCLCVESGKVVLNNGRADIAG